jgi:hypothetical protein
MCLIFLPIDFMRLTMDAWRFTVEGFSHRYVHKNRDQPCIFCRGMDCGFAPRSVHTKIRYWNLWMPRILYPELVTLEPRRGLRKVPVCQREGGYIYTPAYLPLVAIICTILWLIALYSLLSLSLES